MRKFIVFFIIITLFALGTWQVQRMFYKKTLLSNLQKAPVTDLTLQKEEVNYRSILLQGDLLDVHIFLYLGGKNAEYNLIGFLSQQDKVFLVNLGKLDKIHLAQLKKDWPSLSKKVLVKGNIVYPKKNFFVVDHENDLTYNVWHNLNIPKIEEQYNLVLSPYIIRCINLPLKLDYLKPNSPISIYNPHLYYAILWYFLGLTALFIFIKVISI